MTYLERNPGDMGPVAFVSLLKIDKTCIKKLSYEEKKVSFLQTGFINFL